LKSEESVNDCGDTLINGKLPKAYTLFAEQWTAFKTVLGNVKDASGLVWFGGFTIFIIMKDAVLLSRL